MKKFNFLMICVLLVVLLVGCHEGNFIFHLATPEATGEVIVLPTVTPTPELPPISTLEPKVVPEEETGSTTPEPPQALIKGNISSSGEKIYHLPGGAYYDQVKINEDAGERWFATEEEAQAAGWRKSSR